MTNMIQWDPFTELRSTMDRLFDQGFSRPWRYLPATDFRPGFPVDIWETDETVEIKASLPGFRPEDVDIQIVGEVVTIKAQHETEAEQPGRTYYRREIPYGAYTRAFSLPVSVDADAAEAHYEHGMLYLRLPKAAEVRPRQIKIAPQEREPVAQLA